MVRRRVFEVHEQERARHEILYAELSNIEAQGSRETNLLVWLQQTVGFVTRLNLALLNLLHRLDVSERYLARNSILSTRPSRFSECRRSHPVRLGEHHLSYSPMPPTLPLETGKFVQTSSSKTHQRLQC